MNWIYVAVYVVGLLYSWRRFAGFLAYTHGGHETDGYDLALGALFGFLAALVWPILLPVQVLVEHEVNFRGGIEKLYYKPLELRRKDSDDPY